MFTKKTLTRFTPTRRFFSQTVTKDLDKFIKGLGICSSKTEIVYNPTVGELYEYALRSEHISSVDPSIFETTITDTGALNCSSGARMGRSPTDKRIVYDEETKDTIHWGKVNIPITPTVFNFNR